MPNPVGRPPKGSKRKAQSLTVSGRAAKRSRTATKASTAESTTPHPTEAIVPFPADVTAGEVRLTDIVLNDDATVTCDYAFRGMGNMATYVHLGSAFVTDDDVRVKAGQWVYVKYSDNGEDDANTAQAPAVVAHLFGYAQREFALIAWGYRENDDEVTGLLKKAQTNGKTKDTKRIVPSDYLQVIECDEISTILGGNGKLPLVLSWNEKDAQDKDYWDGSWLVKFCGRGNGAGKLWRPDTLSQPQQSQLDAAEKQPSASGTTELDNSSFVDAAETLTDVANAVAAQASEAASDIVEAITMIKSPTFNSLILKPPTLESPTLKPPTLKSPTPKSPFKAKGKTPLKTYAAEKD